ncbi:uncharacterized protein LOC132463352 isoform X2 [Gadus macrocephalus]|uniref:uncharacterized protein LOC132463352 isoform X2 n=1 Tax=Gadus macrocephalus TaxID=80720 RepID=UPI0028CB2A02|nr:uncharacterized protein LOC132463352 isoform X2 [Gadus macrocephalus]
MEGFQPNLQLCFTPPAKHRTPQVLIPGHSLDTLFESGPSWALTMDLLRPTSAPGSRGAVLVANLTRLVVPEHRRLLQISQRATEEPYFMDYIPPARDAIALPRYVAYILVGLVLVLVATYAIVGHLINDLIHDLADCVLGPKTLDDEDVEAEGVDVEEEHCISIHRRVEMEEVEEREERQGLLPGSRLCEEAGASPAPRSALACSSRETRTSAHNVVFSCPVLPHGTSL